ncbi:Gamma-tubulin complex component 3 [Nowakowskiella sp. JEL0078]|nr:Gamma-tubulin complex component 3 [Nowakowskiella sp. JEL0078]
MSTSININLDSPLEQIGLPSIPVVSGPSNTITPKLTEIQGKEKHELYYEGKLVTEAELLKDIIFVFQGIDGKHIKFQKDIGSYVVDQKIGLPKPTREILRRLSELGYLYRVVQDNIKTNTLDLGLGIVGQSFNASIQTELTDFYRLITVLESHIGSEIKSKVNESNENAFSAKGLSLKRLVVWTFEPLQRMRMMAVIVEVCRGLKGGVLLSKIHSYMSHGDPVVQKFVADLLAEVSKPFYAMLRRWIYEGELEDPYSEFFVAVVAGDGKSSTESATGLVFGDIESRGEENLWKNKYVLRNDMVPTFVLKSMAKKIFLIGKSLNFIRYSCSEADFILELSRSVNGETVLEYGDNRLLEKSVDTLYSSTCKKLLDLLFDRFHLKEHLMALRRYLLLQQGDFVQCLMDVVGPGLSKSATTLYKHNLTGALETAIRSSNAEREIPDIVKRLDVRLLEVATEDAGWDVFTLNYHVDDAPLNTILTPTVMLQYSKLFQFLWKLKRAEHVLSAAWRDAGVTMLRGKSEAIKVEDLFKDIHTSRITHAAMLHFVRELSQYLSLEVLEQSWRALESHLDSRKGDLDELIVAHVEYLNRIVGRGVLGGGVNLFREVAAIVDVVLAFRWAQDLLLRYVASEMDRVGKGSAKANIMSFEAQFGIENGLQFDNFLNSDADFGPSLPRIRKMLFENTEKFKEALHGLLKLLNESSEEQLKDLGTRLNFNSCYKLAA